ncbi:hypothetical protein C1645_824332 [Glomus cerebriforme]|uniref:F-box domain-containing protein n=1 Tax=Glomus cerebriforme TaxID=658196 RepID=A0A397T3N4_9GLOM|nr:hypothetical protein C1645_824332 [Glomus cerebriforme]
MEKNPEHTRELLTWIQDAIKAKKLSNPIFTESGIHNAWPFNKFLKQEPYKTIPKKLRDYRSIVYSCPNIIHLDFKNSIEFSNRSLEAIAVLCPKLKYFNLCNNQLGNYISLHVREVGDRGL